MIDNKTIGQRLKVAREATGLNRSQFAEKAKVDTSQYSKAERGVEGLGPDKLKAIVDAHQLNMDFLSTGKGEILHDAGLNLDSQGKKPPTVDLLSKALSDQAEASKLQAQANDKYAQGFASLATILERMEKEMARETTQADLKISLEEIASDVIKLVERQQTAIEEFRDEFSELKADRTKTSRGAGKKGDRNGGDSDKIGTPP